MNKSLVEMTAEIIQSQISTKQMTTDEVKSALNETFHALKDLHNAEFFNAEKIDSKNALASPSLHPQKSIQKNKIVCLECGQEFKALSSKHLASHGLDSKSYRKKYGFSARQPLCAKSVSEYRSASGKERGISENLQKAIAARTRKTIQ